MTLFPTREIATGLRFPEGPVALDDGSVLVVEMRSGTIARVSHGGKIDIVATVGGGPNGGAMGADGRLYVANNGGMASTVVDGEIRFTGEPSDDYAGGSIQAVDIDTGAVETIATDCEGDQLSAPNDLVVDKAGGIYFTDSGKTQGRHRVRGGLYYLTFPDRRVRRVVWPLEVPNGVGLSPRDDRIYVSETMTGRVWYWDVSEPGVVRRGHTPRALSHGSGGTLLHGFDGFALLDSLAVDGQGNVCVATLMRGVISVIAPDGRVEESVRLPQHDPLLTNICFGGPDLRTAYITSSGLGRLYEVEWPWKGLRLHHSR
jgi:gluconolactonase